MFTWSSVRHCRILVSSWKGLAPITSALVNPYLPTHSQVVLVDNKHAAIGGLDLCYGRWDTHTHPLADVHPTNLFKTLFPGQEYNNSRILDFSQLNNYVSNPLSIREYARMPWHDVGTVFLFFDCLALLTNECSGSYDIGWHCRLGHCATLYWALEHNQAEKDKGMRMCLFYYHFLIRFLSTAMISKCDYFMRLLIFNSFHTKDLSYSCVPSRPYTCS